VNHLRLLHGLTVLAGLAFFGWVELSIAQPTPTPTPSGTIYENGFFSLRKEGTRIVSLRVDGNGTGQYGIEIIASGGYLGPAGTISLVTRTLIVNSTSSPGFVLSFPFVRAGYYDADTHLNYPHDRDTLGFTSLVLPFRELVGSSGNVVRIEHFKRLPLGRYYLPINIDDGGKLLMRSDISQNWDIETLWPGQKQLTYDVREDLVHLISGALNAPFQMTVLPRGQYDSPGGAPLLPNVSFYPDETITYEPTGKSISLSRLMTEFMRQGIYWAPSITAGGDWVIGAVESHLFDDPRSWYLRRLRQDLLQYLGNIGYDRFEHFGYLYPWGRYPDYGAGGLLNVPPGNAPWDMRALHLCGLWIHCLAEYVLATGDLDFLHSKRTRWVSTNGPESQPVCGGAATSFDYVLSSGDVRLDGKAPVLKHSLGQEFTTQASFSIVKARLANPSLSEANHGKLILRGHREGQVIAQTSFSLSANLSQEVSLQLNSTLPPGKYYLEVKDDDSGSRYFGPGVGWWTETEGSYSGGDAYSGPMRCTVIDALQTLFAYMRDHMGAGQQNIIYYRNDPQYNIPNHKSGRNGVCTTTSYWEGAGGGYDAFESIWYPAACSAMAELADLLGDSGSAEEYRDLRAQADIAFNSRYWGSFSDGGTVYQRYHACEDWSGVKHDFGFSYVNLEAASRGISSATQARQILTWLDRGRWSSNSGATWNKGIYSLWEVAPPYNTRSNSTWLNVTGTLPFLEVLTNGGTRLDVAARDLHVRAENLSIDNAHERNLRILSRYASPDRLTGGRTINDPGGRGRWQFLGPANNNLDFEGFREIFTSNSILGSWQPVVYLGLRHTAQGLRLKPRVPSGHSMIRFGHIGYWGAVFDITAESHLQPVLENSAGTDSFPLTMDGSAGQTFIPDESFNRVGLLVGVSPGLQKTGNQVGLLLERQSGVAWNTIAENWYNHVQDGQWIWISTDQVLPGGVQYRVRVYNVSPDTGETLSLAYNPSDIFPSGYAFEGEQSKGTLTGDFAIQVTLEKISLVVQAVLNPGEILFGLAKGGGPVAGSMEVILDPGEEALLIPDPESTPPPTSGIQAWRLYDQMGP